MDTLTFERSSTLPIELTKFRGRIQRVVEMTIGEINRHSNQHQIKIWKTEEVDNRETFWLIFELRGLTHELRERFNTLLAEKLSNVSVVWSLEARRLKKTTPAHELLGGTSHAAFNNRIDTTPDISNLPPPIATPKELPSEPQWIQFQRSPRAR